MDVKQRYVLTVLVNIVYINQNSTLTFFDENLTVLSEPELFMNINCYRVSKLFWIIFNQFKPVLKKYNDTDTKDNTSYILIA